MTYWLPFLLALALVGACDRKPEHLHVHLKLRLGSGAICETVTSPCGDAVVTICQDKAPRAKVTLDYIDCLVPDNGGAQ